MRARRLHRTCSTASMKCGILRACSGTPRSSMTWRCLRHTRKRMHRFDRDATDCRCCCSPMATRACPHLRRRSSRISRAADTSCSSIVHPYEASAATVAGGTVVSMLDSGGKFRQPIQDVFSEWETEDAVLNQVTSASNDAERIRLLREYLSGLGKTHVALRRWVDDARAA